jgi:hypothetical protein
MLANVRVANCIAPTPLTPQDIPFCSAGMVLSICCQVMPGKRRPLHGKSDTHKHNFRVCYANAFAGLCIDRASDISLRLRIRHVAGMGVSFVPLAGLAHKRAVQYTNHRW